MLDSRLKFKMEKRKEKWDSNHYKCVRFLSLLKYVFEVEMETSRAGPNFLGPRAERAENGSQRNQKKEEKMDVLEISI